MEDIPLIINELFFSIFIEFITSLIGLATNGLALVVIRRVKRLRNSFGALCIILVTANICVILIKLVWILHPESLMAHDESVKAKVFGEITVTLWFIAMKVHVAISIDRFLNIVYPPKVEKRAHTIILGAVIIAVACIQTSFMHLYPGAYFAHDSVDHSWSYRGSEWAETYATYVDFYVCIIEMGVVFTLDCITLSKLKKFARKHPEFAEKRKKNERRMLVQSILQSVPYMLMLLVYFEVTPRLESTFGIFLATTLSWQACTALDGLFIIVFHAKKIRKKPALGVHIII